MTGASNNRCTGRRWVKTCYSGHRWTEVSDGSLSWWECVDCGIVSAMGYVR